MARIGGAIAIRNLPFFYYEFDNDQACQQAAMQNLQRIPIQARRLALYRPVLSHFTESGGSNIHGGYVGRAHSGISGSDGDCAASRG
jgi:hypothetical protein